MLWDGETHLDTLTSVGWLRLTSSQLVIFIWNKITTFSLLPKTFLMTEGTVLLLRCNIWMDGKWLNCAHKNVSEICWPPLLSPSSSYLFNEAYFTLDKRATSFHSTSSLMKHSYLLCMYSFQKERKTSFKDKSPPPTHVKLTTGSIVRKVDPSASFLLSFYSSSQYSVGNILSWWSVQYSPFSSYCQKHVGGSRVSSSSVPPPSSSFLRNTSLCPSDGLLSLPTLPRPPNREKWEKNGKNLDNNANQARNSFLLLGGGETQKSPSRGIKKVTKMPSLLLPFSIGDEHKNIPSTIPPATFGEGGFGVVLTTFLFFRVRRFLNSFVREWALSWAVAVRIVSISVTTEQHSTCLLLLFYKLKDIPLRPLRWIFNALSFSLSLSLLLGWNEWERPNWLLSHSSSVFLPVFIPYCSSATVTYSPTPGDLTCRNSIGRWGKGEKRHSYDSAPHGFANAETSFLPLFSRWTSIDHVKNALLISTSCFILNISSFHQPTQSQLPFISTKAAWCCCCRFVATQHFQAIFFWLLVWCHRLDQLTMSKEKKKKKERKWVHSLT